jgi:hypothetical protein
LKISATINEKVRKSDKKNPSLDVGDSIVSAAINLVLGPVRRNLSRKHPFSNTALPGFFPGVTPHNPSSPGCPENTPFADGEAMRKIESEITAKIMETYDIS